jgi:signal transduction histidine kinase
MRERVQRIGGQLQIDSGPGGTRITVRVARP